MKHSFERITCNINFFIWAGFATSGTIDVDGQSIAYTYNLLEDTFNSQSMQRLSRSQKTAVSTAYSDYSGTYDYNNQLILAALNGASTKFPNSMVDFDFSNFGLEGRAGEWLSTHYYICA